MSVENRGQFVFFLNESLKEEERIFKLKEAVLEEDILMIKLMYPAERARLLTEDLKNKVNIYARASVPEVFRVEVEFVRAYCDESTVRTALMEFLYKEAVLVYPKLKDAELLFEFEPYTVKISIKVPDYVFGYCTTSGIKEKIEDHLANIFIEEFELSFIPVEAIVILEQSQRETKMETIKTIQIEHNLDMTHHGSIARFPRYIKDVLKRESENETICGKISNFRKMTTKDCTRTFYVFKLNDTTGEIDVKYFPHISAKRTIYDKFESLKDGDLLTVEGKVAADKFSKANSMILKYYTICRINFGSINHEIEYLPLPKSYYRIKPIKYTQEILETVDFFQMNDDLPDSLKEKSYVVFDFETTGLSATTDGPIEIGAVKISNGVIVETFSTLIKPIYKDGRTSLGERIIELTGITDEMLETAPTQGEVVGDIYKFMHGEMLVAHNADFDMGFLKKLGDDNRFKFDNEYLDTIKIARERLKYAKYNLAFLCEKLEIDLKNAHRGLADAIATAKVFLKLAKMPLLRKKNQ